MNVVYIAIIVLSATSLGAEILLRNLWGIKGFGVEKRFFDFHGKTIPIEDFVPHTVTHLLIFVFAFGVSGIIYLLLMHWALSIFLGLLTGFWVTFILSHWIFPMRERVRKNTLPKDYLQSGMDALCSSAIDGDGYGEIVVEYNNRNYRFPALSANGTDINRGDKVVLVHNEQGVWWVEKDSEVFNIMNE